MLFLDGTLQSSSQSEHEYHEALVHPAMFVHPNPRRVAIVGGGEGATLREVLKHKTVEAVTMIEIDPQMVDVARRYLPSMSNCSDLIGRADCCFDDALANVVFEDAYRWFTDRWEADSAILQEPSLDVIIIDALDPEDSGPIADKLYTDVVFISSLVNSLSANGILLIQIGTPPFLNDPRPDKGIYWRRELLFNILEELPEVEAMMVYEEAHCGFNEPHSFLVVCLSAECRSRWYAESDVVDYFIYDRIVRTHSKERALLYYDGSMQHSYQVTPKAWETVYCRREPTPFECAYRNLDPTKELHDFYVNDPEASSFRIDVSKDEHGEVDGSLVYATTDISIGSYIMPNHLASSLLITNKTLANLEANLDVEGAGRVAVIEDLVDFMEEFGHESSVDGIGLYVVEVGATFAIRTTENAEEANVGRWVSLRCF
jgi:spermidine synthase